jgi:hypothetical protein
MRCRKGRFAFDVWDRSESGIHSTQSYSRGYNFNDIFIYRERDSSTQLDYRVRKITIRKDNELTTKRTSLGVVPVQNRNIPSSVNMRYAQ